MGKFSQSDFKQLCSGAVSNSPPQSSQSFFSAVDNSNIMYKHSTPICIKEKLQTVDNSQLSKATNSIGNGVRDNEIKENQTGIPEIEVFRGIKDKSVDYDSLSLNTSETEVQKRKNNSPQNSRTTYLNMPRKNILNSGENQYLNKQRDHHQKNKKNGYDSPKQIDRNLEGSMKNPNDFSAHEKVKPYLNIQRNQYLNPQEKQYLNIQRNRYLNLQEKQYLNTQRNQYLNNERIQIPNAKRNQIPNNTGPQYLNNPRNLYLNHQCDKSLKVEVNKVKNEQRRQNDKSECREKNSITKSHQTNDKSDSSSLSYSEDISTDTDTSNETSNTTDKEENKFRFFTNEFYTIMYSNIDQSLTGKREELIGHIENQRPSIVMLTEIEPKFKKDQTKQIKESEIMIPNYALFMNTNRKRGVALYIENKLNPRECTDEINSKFEECVFCEFEGSNKEKILIGCMYKSPNSSKENIDNMISTIKNENIQKYDAICIAGDFNYPKIDWNNTNKTSVENERFVEALKDAYLIQKVEYPTRNIRIDQQANIVDLVLVNEESLISEIVHCAPLGNSDHDILYFQLNIPKRKKKKERIKKFNLNKGKYKEMRKEIRKENWSDMEKMDVEETWECIKTKIIEQMNKHIPKTEANDTKKLKPCWMNNKVLRKIKKKYHAYKRYLVTKQGREYEKYIRERNKCTKAIKKAKKKHEKNIANECKNNPRKFWKYVNDKCKSNVGISSLKDKDGNLITNDRERAEILNEFFTSVFLKEDLTNLPKIDEAEFSNGNKIKEVIIEKKEVEKKLKALLPGKARGPDQIPPRVLKELSKELAEPLTILFNKSLKNGVVPNEWKFAEVTAIFKKGNRTDPGNYRPVSLTSVCCKIMEQFIRDSIVDHMTENNLYSECQHGFRKKRSCVTQLIEVHETLTEMIDDGKSMDIIYLDFKKAFDSIPHERLLLKMKAYGITGKTLQWVRSFLSNRQQRVRVGNDYSSKSKVTSGIPQGSILGPVLFTIFINDLPEAIEVNCKVFADDTKIYDSSKNHAKIQNDLYKMQKWTETWNLYFNVAKCKVMYMGKKNPRIEYYMQIEKEKQKLDPCEEEKDLGITFDPKLNFDSHISNITKKANQMLGIIKRTFTFIDKHTFLKLYKALVRSHLEYGNVIWSPIFKRQSVQIESIQRRATKLVPECRDMTYDKRLRYLKLYSLKGRRDRGDLIQTYKIFKGIDDINPENIFSLATYKATRNQGNKIRLRHCKTDIRKYSFSHRIVERWNTLPKEIKEAPSVNAFKNRLDTNPKLVDRFYNYDERGY